MSRIFLYAHGGSGNHGCEAIVRSTVELLQKLPAEELVLISSAPEEDKAYGIDALCTVERDKRPYPKASLAFLKAYLSLKLRHDYISMDQLSYKEAFDRMHKGDLALSIGGDNYCYADVKKYGMLQDMALARGAKTVLWGCSVEPARVQDAEIAQDLKRYSLIIARETISYEALREVNAHTYLAADPAFTLMADSAALPENFQTGNMVGVNLSPMVMDSEPYAGITEKNYRSLMEWILQETDMGIALFPHVVWNGGDDRVPLRKLYKAYADTGRVLFIEDQSCERLKYMISQCRFFVGARTHATIAAYSSCVPTLVVGYSVKARGIAKDLFGEENHYVLPVQELTKPTQLCEAFSWIFHREEPIKNDLKQQVPQMKARAAGAGELLGELWR